VHVETERARQVLAVPVAALLALAGGGHGVELVDGGSRRIVAVDTGTYADGWVQVTGPELRAGSTVVVPA
jgi:multidrug efflux pump subunit AcrA (membrane-fusion protein)